MIPLTYVELFAGAGGLSLGLEMAGWRCLGHAEWDAFPRRILTHRWPDVPLWGDVTTLTGADITANGIPTLLSGGSPCQDLSVAGKRAGLDGDRSSLFFHQLRLWEESGAPYCLWENVLGAFSSNAGRDFAAVLSAFVGSPVAVPRDGWAKSGVAAGATGVAAWRVLDAQYFGVPQRRRRIFVLGTRTGGCDPAEVLALTESLSGDSEPCRKTRKAAAADSGTSLASGSLTPWDAQSKRCFASTGIAPSLPSASSSGQQQIQAAERSGQQQPSVLNIAHTIDAGEWRGPNRNQIGNIVVAEQAVPLIEVTRSGRQSGPPNGKPNDPMFTLQAASQHGVVVFPLQNPTMDKAQNGLGIGIDGDPMYSLESVSHGVVAYDSRGNGDGNVDTTLPGDHCNRVTDYTAIVLRNREGKPGGGKGPLLSPERSLTLGTSNDQVVFPALTMGAHPAAPGLNGQDAHLCAAAIHAVQPGVPRRLTPVECERLMGWPDGWTDVPSEKGKPAADSARYKACGNGVASPVAAWIGFRLRDAITAVSR